MTEEQKILQLRLLEVKTAIAERNNLPATAQWWREAYENVHKRPAAEIVLTQEHDVQISSAFPSNYLKSSDLKERNVRVVMDRVEFEEVGGDQKPVLYFQNKEKGIVLNKTNSNNIAAAYGEETDDWQGREIILYPAMTDFQGKTVPCIRVRIPTAKDRGPPVAPRPPVQSENPADDTDIPF